MERRTHLYPMPTGELTHKGQELAPEIDHAFRDARGRCGCAFADRDSDDGSRPARQRGN